MSYASCSRSAAIVLLLAATADASVLCTRRHTDGRLDGTVVVRPACRAKEVQLSPTDVAFCCGAPTTTTTTTSSTQPTAPPCPTTTTLGIPNCGAGGGSCLGYCVGGQNCAGDGQGGCACTGPLQCGRNDNFCGGACGAGTSCQQIAVPPGCGPIGCSCQ